MEKTEFSNLEQWFEAYLMQMYGTDDYINANLKLKEEHSRRTAREMRELAEELNWPAEDKILAEAIGLLHDIGRFEQFRTYQTYNDARSVNHGRLGIKVLRDGFVLQGLDQIEMSIIESSIEYHGVKELPPALCGKRLQFARLIRDADKIDIYVVVIDNFKKFASDSDKYSLEIEFPVSGGCSAEVVNAVMQGQPVDYKLLRSMDDFRLLQMGWVFDINYKPALRRIFERGYLQSIAEMLPQDADVQAVIRRIYSYVQQRLSEQ